MGLLCREEYGCPLWWEARKSMAHQFPLVSTLLVNTPHGLTNERSMTKPTFAEHPIIWLKDFLTPYDSRELRNSAKATWWQTKSMGYFLEQSTKPQTIGYSLADSPVGLLAWIYEKLVTWTDHYKWTDDESTSLKTIFNCRPDFQGCSINLDLGLLVLSRWARRVCENLLRIFQ